MAMIRYMSNDDLLQYQRLASICYTYVYDAPPRMLTEEELRQRVGAFDEGGTLLSAMIHNRYLARFEGRDVALVGIGGVVTDPTSRGQRSVRRLFETYLPKLRDEGYVFSALYPFSHVFYRKFGYELAFERRTAEVNPSSLRENLCRADEIIRVLPEQDDQGMGAIYAHYAKNKRFAILRDDAMWKELRKGTPWDNLKYAYVLKHAGRPVAYWIGKVEKENGATLVVEDLAYTCRIGCEAIFAMLRGLNEIDRIRMTVPEEINLRWLVREPYDVTVKSVSCGGMLRVMDVIKALSMLKAPSIPGSFTIDVSDGQIPENNGAFAIAGDGQSLTVTRVEEVAADLRCGIGGLSALIGGMQDFEDALRAGCADLMDDAQLPFMSQLFARHKAHLNWQF